MVFFLCFSLYHISTVKITPSRCFGNRILHVVLAHSLRGGYFRTSIVTYLLICSFCVPALYRTCTKMAWLRSGGGCFEMYIMYRCRCQALLARSWAVLVAVLWWHGILALSKGDVLRYTAHLVAYSFPLFLVLANIVGRCSLPNSHTDLSWLDDSSAPDRPGRAPKHVMLAAPRLGTATKGDP